MSAFDLGALEYDLTLNFAPMAEQIKRAQDAIVAFDDRVQARLDSMANRQTLLNKSFEQSANQLATLSKAAEIAANESALAIKKELDLQVRLNQRRVELTNDYQRQGAKMRAIDDSTLKGAAQKEAAEERLVRIQSRIGNTYEALRIQEEKIAITRSKAALSMEESANRQAAATLRLNKIGLSYRENLNQTVIVEQEAAARREEIQRREFASLQASVFKMNAMKEAAYRENERRDAADTTRQRAHALAEMEAYAEQTRRQEALQRQQMAHIGTEAAAYAEQARMDRAGLAERRDHYLAENAAYAEMAARERAITNERLRVQREAMAARRTQLTAMGTVGTNMMMAGGALAIPVIAAGTEAAKWQRQQEQLAAMAGQSPAQVAAAASRAQGIGGALGIDSGLILEQYTKIRQMGRTNAQAILEVGTAAQAARGTFSQFKDVVQAVDGVMRSFDLDVSKTRQVTDVLEKTVRMSGMSWEQMAGQMEKARSVTAGVHASVQDLSAVMIAMVRGGAPANDIGTVLAQALARLLKPTKQVTDAAKAMNLEWLATGQAAAHIDKVGLVQTFVEIEKHAGSAARIMQLLGVRQGGGRTSSSILALFSPEGLKALQEASVSLHHALGSAATDSDKAMKTLQAQWEKFLEQLRNLGRDMGSTVLPMMTSFLQRLNDISQAFKGLSPTTKEIIGVGSGALAGFLGIGGAVLWIIVQLGKLKLALQTLGMTSGIQGLLGIFRNVFGAARSGATMGEILAGGGIAGAVALVGVALAGIFIGYNVAQWLKQFQPIKDFFEGTAGYVEKTQRILQEGSLQGSRTPVVQTMVGKYLQAYGKARAMERYATAHGGDIDPAFSSSNVPGLANQADQDYLNRLLASRHLTDIAQASNGQLAGMASDALNAAARSVTFNPLRSAADRAQRQAGKTPAWEEAFAKRVGQLTGVECGQIISNLYGGKVSVSTVVAGGAGRRIGPIPGATDAAGNPLYKEGTLIYFPAAGKREQHFGVTHMMPGGIEGLLASTQPKTGPRRITLLPLARVAAQHGNYLRSYELPGAASGGVGPEGELKPPPGSTQPPVDTSKKKGADRAALSAIRTSESVESANIDAEMHRTIAAARGMADPFAMIEGAKTVAACKKIMLRARTQVAILRVEKLLPADGGTAIMEAAQQRCAALEKDLEGRIAQHRAAAAAKADRATMGAMRRGLASENATFAKQIADSGREPTITDAIHPQRYIDQQDRRESTLEAMAQNQRRIDLSYLPAAQRANSNDSLVKDAAAKRDAAIAKANEERSARLDKLSERTQELDDKQQAEVLRQVNLAIKTDDRAIDFMRGKTPAERNRLRAASISLRMGGMYKDKITGRMIGLKPGATYDELAATAGMRNDEADEQDRSFAVSEAERRAEAAGIGAGGDSKDKSAKPLAIAAALAALMKDPMFGPTGLYPLNSDDQKRIKDKIDRYQAEAADASATFADEKAQYQETRRLELLKADRKAGSNYLRARGLKPRGGKAAMVAQNEAIDMIIAADKRRVLDRQYGIPAAVADASYNQAITEAKKLTSTRSIWSELADNAKSKFHEISDSFAQAVGQMVAKGGTLKSFWKNLWGELVSWFTSFVVTKILAGIESMFHPKAKSSIMQQILGGGGAAETPLGAVGGLFSGLTTPGGSSGSGVPDLASNPLAAGGDLTSNPLSAQSAVAMGPVALANALGLGNAGSTAGASSGASAAGAIGGIGKIFGKGNLASTLMQVGQLAALPMLFSKNAFKGANAIGSITALATMFGKGGLLGSGGLLGKLFGGLGGLGGLMPWIAGIAGLAAFAKPIGKFFSHLFGHHKRHAGSVSGGSFPTPKFDDPVNDAAALTSGRDYASLFTQGVASRMTQVMTGMTPSQVGAFRRHGQMGLDLVAQMETRHAAPSASAHVVVNVHHPMVLDDAGARTLADKTLPHIDRGMAELTSRRLRRGSNGGRNY